MVDLSQRWDAPEMIRTRAKVNYWTRHGGVGARIEELHEKKGREYYELLREPGFIEDLAILCKHGAIDLGLINESMGLIVQERWRVWAEATFYLREARHDDRVFERFEDMARKLRNYRAGGRVTRLPFIRWFFRNR